MPHKSRLVGNTGLLLTMMKKTFFKDEGGREELSFSTVCSPQIAFLYFCFYSDDACECLC